MFNENKTRLLVDRKEISKLKDKINGESLEIGQTIGSKIIEDCFNDNWGSSSVNMAMSMMFEMGRIQGIREERRKRKERA